MDTGSHISAAEAELIAAERALAIGDAAAARRHADEAERHGAAHQVTLRLRAAANTLAAKQHLRTALSGWAGLGAAALIYLLIAVRRPTEWSAPVWLALALVLAPGICGAVTGRLLGAAKPGGARFWSGFRAGAAATLAYAAMSMVLLRRQIGDPSVDHAQEMVAGLLAASAFALAAGLVSGTAAAFAGPRGTRSAAQGAV